MDGTIAQSSKFGPFLYKPIIDHEWRENKQENIKLKPYKIFHTTKNKKEKNIDLVSQKILLWNNLGIFLVDKIEN